MCQLPIRSPLFMEFLTLLKFKYDS
uniref:Uncharacterized protein n=1 Tax=Rhizophora mucronata TaxID=61149 RepID=A0A2P2QZ72_RHIMU